MPFRMLQILKEVAPYALDLVQSRKLYTALCKYMFVFVYVCICVVIHYLYVLLPYVFKKIYT